nr:50S ribosomal protein L6 [Cavernulicola chilensis]
MNYSLKVTSHNCNALPLLLYSPIFKILAWRFSGGHSKMVYKKYLVEGKKSSVFFYPFDISLKNRLFIAGQIGSNFRSLNNFTIHLIKLNIKMSKAPFILSFNKYIQSLLTKDLFGVTKIHTVQLILRGVGYKIEETKSDAISLRLGRSDPITFPKWTRNYRCSEITSQSIKVSSVNEDILHQFVSRLRAYGLQRIAKGITYRMEI